MTADAKGRIPASKTGAKGTTRALNATKRAKEDKPAPTQEDVAMDKIMEDAPPAAETAPTELEQASGDGEAAPRRVDGVRHPFGVRRLDDLLDGGLEERTFTLLYGPPFLGKEHLSRRLSIEALKRGVPAIVIHTDATAAQVQERMEEMDDVVEAARKKGLLQLVDCYSRPI